jgi:outer membrane immunogenic protein
LRYIFSLAHQLLIRASLGNRFEGGRMKRLALAAALACVAGGQVLASDLPPPAAAPPPPRAPAAYIPPASPVYNWGGIYFGFNLGYGFGTSDWADSNNASGLTSTGNFSTTGFLVGPTIGANWQVDSLVFGVEADFDGSWIDGKNSSLFCSSTGIAGGVCETRNFWFSTARARVGYAADRVLFYGTAGGALGDVAPGISGVFQRTTKAGWTAGAGIEAAFGENVTARIEYLFMDLQNTTCNNSSACGVDLGSAPPNDTVKFSTSMVRLGVDYKFH